MAKRFNGSKSWITDGPDELYTWEGVLFNEMTSSRFRLTWRAMLTSNQTPGRLNGLRLRSMSRLKMISILGESFGGAQSRSHIVP
jgi:hypothetical protein